MVGVWTCWPARIALIISQEYPASNIREIPLRRHSRAAHYDPTRSRADEVVHNNDVCTYRGAAKTSPHDPLDRNEWPFRCAQHTVDRHSQFDSVPNCMPPLLCMPFLAKRTKRTYIWMTNATRYFMQLRSIEAHQMAEPTKWEGSPMA
eukprot:SAG31_NODE_106_length_24954_cov_17.726413_16_plen_148_part_00